MSKRAWLLIFAFGITVGSQTPAQNSPDQPIYQQTESDRQQQRQGSTTPLGFPVRILEEPEQSESSKREQREAEQREIDDLVAQQLAAKAADRSYKVGIAQTVLAFFGTVALIYSLQLNRKATKAAVAAAEAARHAVNLERAWLTPGGIQSGPFNNGSIEGQPVTNGMVFLPAFNNTGRSPALHVGMRTAFQVIDKDDPVPHFAFENTTPRGIVPSGGGISGRIFIGDSDTQAFWALQKRLILCCKVEYYDIFTDPTKASPRISISCVEVLYSGGTVVVEGESSRPDVSFMPVGDQNTAI